MRETKYAYRIPPCSKYDIAGMESWLEDMAARGLFLDLDGLFLGFAAFIRDEPQTLRFRLAATDTAGGMFSPTNDPEEDVILTHEQMGWHYRGRWGQFHIYASADPAAPELHTDPRVQALTIQALTKFQRRELVSLFLYALIYYLFHGSVLFLLTAAWGLGRTVLALAFALSFPAMEAVHLVRMTRLKRQLQKGIPISHRADWQGRRWRRYTGLTAKWIAGLYLAFVFLGLWSESVLEENRVSLADWNKPLPFATVEDLFPEGQLGNDHPFINNDLAYWSNWLAPENYDYTEWREITLPDGTQTSAYLNIFYHRTRSDWFALGLARELADHGAGSLYDRIFSGRAAPEEIAGIEADYAVSYTGYNPGIVLCADGIVIRVHYSREVAQYYTPDQLARLVLESLL